MKYLRLWYYKRTDLAYKRPSFCRWKEFGHNNHYEKNAEKWFIFFRQNMPSGVTERLYILLRNYYGENFKREENEF